MGKFFDPLVYTLLFEKGMKLKENRPMETTQVPPLPPSGTAYAKDNLIVHQNYILFSKLAISQIAEIAY